MENQEKLEKFMNRNIKLYPTMLSLMWDVLFVWTISTLFFTTQKGLTYSQVVMLDSFLMLFGCLLSIPLNQLFRKVNSIVATRVGVCGYAIYLLICIFGKNYAMFVFAQVFLSSGYIICGLRGNDLIVDSLSLVKKDNHYEKIYGRGLSLYYTFEAVGAVAITYVFNWNPYAAYWISLSVVVLAFVFTFLFKEPRKFQQQNVSIDAKQPNSNKKNPDSYFRVLKSGFFICLLVYMFFMRGVLSISVSNFKIYLQQSINAGIIPLWAFGYFVAVAKLGSAISSRIQFKFNMKYGVKSLISFSGGILITFYLNGIIYLIAPHAVWSFVIIAIISILQAAILPPCRIFVNNYMQVCMSKKNINKGYTIRTLVEYLGYSAISAMYAALLGGFGDNYGLTSVVYISILAIPIVVSTIMFIRVLIKKHTEKFTIIKDEYVND